MKHAYLIMAHNNPGVLRVLLEMIDDERNDIFLHVDKKSNLLKENKFAMKKAGLYVLEKRINVIWGGYPQIEAEMLLFRESNKHGPYSYYHLLSGVDLPIKSQDYIHSFMDEHQGKEFIGYMPKSDKLDREIRKRVGRYWVMSDWFRTDNIVKKAIRKAANIVVGLIPRKMDMDFKKGANWVSITESCVRYLLEHDRLVGQRFGRCYLADEVFLQTIVYTNPSLRASLYRPESGRSGYMREIDWNRGKPYTWTIADKDMLSHSDALFARKFSEADMEIVNWVRDELGK